METQFLLVLKMAIAVDKNWNKQELPKTAFPSDFRTTSEAQQSSA